MFVRDAKARCPHLMIVPYNFDAYEEVYLQGLLLHLMAKASFFSFLELENFEFM